jgi:cytochrome P450
MSTQLLRDELLTMLRTGHSTLREAISWCWYLLGTHPEAQERMIAEVDAVLGDRPPTFEDLPRLTYTWRVLHEAMRLYPPAWVFVRSAIDDDEIGGYHIPARSMIVICPYITQRTAAWWPEPEAFDPDRFAPERSAGRPHFAFCPFGGGPRLCIGNSFAIMEATVILAMTAQRFRVEVDPSRPVKLVLYVSLMAHNLWLRMVQRKATGSGANVTAASQAVRVGSA